MESADPRCLGLDLDPDQKACWTSVLPIITPQTVSDGSAVPSRRDQERLGALPLADNLCEKVQ